MAKKDIWINIIHFGNSRRADLSKPISSSNNDFVIVNSQVEVDLRGNPSTLGTEIKKGNVIYIAANGFYKFPDGSEEESLRIVAKGVVHDVYDRSGVPVAVLVQGSFRCLTTPMINGLDAKRLTKVFRNHDNPARAPFWTIDPKEANYIDKNIFGDINII
jgi:hypothetical protein